MSSSTSSAVTDDEEIQRFYQRFLQVLASNFPLEKVVDHDHVFVFHTENEINRVVDIERPQIIRDFNTTVYDPKTPCLHICLRLKEFGGRMQKSFLEFKAKNRELQRQCEAEMKEEFKRISTAMRKSVLRRLLRKPDMTLEEMEKLLKTKKVVQMASFVDNWGDVFPQDWFEGQRKMMMKKLEEVGRELLAMQKKHLEEEKKKKNSPSSGKETGSKKTPAPVKGSDEATSSSSSSSSAFERRAAPAPSSKNSVDGDDENVSVEQMDLKATPQSKQGKMQKISRFPVEGSGQGQEASSTSSSSDSDGEEAGKTADDSLDDVVEVEQMNLDSAAPKENKAVPQLRTRKISLLSASSSSFASVPVNQSSDSDESYKNSGSASSDDNQEDEVVASAKSKMKAMRLDSTGKDKDDNDTVVSMETVDGTTTTTSTTASNSNDGNYPLIFRLATDVITVGTRVGDHFQKLNLSLAPVLGIDSGKNLVSGDKDQALKCKEHWWLADFLREQIPPEKEITFKVDDEEVTVRLSLELFLGIILKSLKKSAESLLKRTYTWAYITVPFWLCSPQRIQVKGGAMIAGFSQVNIANQETLAAFAHALKRAKPTSQCDILVLSENFGMLSAIVYDWSNRKLTMKHDFYETDFTRSSRGIRTEAEVDALCRSAHLEMGSTVKVVLFVTESMEWLEAMMNGAEEMGYESPPESPSSDDMFGAPALCFQEVVKGPRPVVWEYTSPLTYPNKDGPSKPHVKMMGPKSLLPQEISCPLPFEVFKATKEPRILQENYRTGNMVSVGEIQLKKGREVLPNANGLQLTFDVAADGVATLKEIQIRNPGKAGGVNVEDFEWNAPNLCGEEIEDMKKMVASISMM